ncbi:MAG: GNAT family N-acetyltransferase [Oscillospiraceae bacterium]
MYIRAARNDDLPAICKIISQAQSYLKSRGVDQWQDGYPDEERLRRDISLGVGRVVCENDSIPLAYAAIFFGDEPSYSRIYDGAWLTCGEYGAVHRIATAEIARRSGSASALLAHAESLCTQRGVPSVRIDTHADNAVMRTFIEKHGFVYCGVIYVSGTAENGSPRVAYEKVLASD